MEINCPDCAAYLAEDSLIVHNSRKMKIVVGFNLVMMIGEIIVGYRSGSMALVAEGWHMASHVGALIQPVR